MSNLDTGLYECNSRHQFWPRDYSPSRRSRSSRSSSEPSRSSRRKVGESTKSIESIVGRAKSIVYTRLDRLRGIQGPCILAKSLCRGLNLYLLVKGKWQVLIQSATV